MMAAGLCALPWRNASAAPIPSHGHGAPNLEGKVDALVKSLIAERNLPGVSVAVSVKGKMVLAKGYGWRNFETKLKMFDDTNIRIGSVTKATITGPAAFGLMKKKNIDPKTKKLYGASGVLGNAFDAAINTGVSRHTPILEIGISPDDKVWTWYRNGKVSKGSSPDLDQYSTPQTFKPPAGRSPNDMWGASFAKNGKVYSWWIVCEAPGKKCGLHTAVGTPTDLEAHKKLSEAAVAFPKGVGITNLVGIGIAKSNDHVYAWYDNGKFSQGSSMDFDDYEGLKSYTTGAGKPWEIRGIDIAKNDHVYAWMTNGKASSGMSHDLDKYISAYNYTMPSGQSPDWKSWYSQITIQNLLDHKAGFWGSGDAGESAAMFDVDEDDLTYAQVHKHFLRTRQLLGSPGSVYSYSNHGFGLWTLLIEKLAGKAYYAYVRDNYLAPMNLDDDIVPEKANPGDCRFAARHEFQDGGSVPKVLKFEQWGLGLAAGGFRSSAKHLAMLMLTLEAKYTGEQLDQMGWGKNGKGALSHSGLTGGGNAYAVMYPDGYKSNSGKDLSEVHVVVITNVSGETKKNGKALPAISSEIKALADQIALAVPDSNVSSDYELGKPVGGSPCTYIK